MSETITQELIDKILDEADFSELPESSSKKLAAIKPAGISLNGFKTLWPKIRPYLLVSISVLQIFRQTAAVNAIAQAIAFIDLIVAGQMPVAQTGRGGE